MGKPFLLMFGVLLSGCTIIGNASPPPRENTTMVASWYKHGSRTANGERFDPQGLTVAHRTLPFNTMLRITHKGESVEVRVNDRGPFIKGRDIDLSEGVARRLGCGGICRVQVERLH